MRAESFCDERLVDLVEHGLGLRKGIGERLAHADRLAALARKNECARHQDGSLDLSNSRGTRTGRARSQGEERIAPHRTVHQMRRRQPLSMLRSTTGCAA